jgi:hypothetical protein
MGLHGLLQRPWRPLFIYRKYDALWFVGWMDLKKSNVFWVATPCSWERARHLEEHISPFSRIEE